MRATEFIVEVVDEKSSFKIDWETFKIKGGNIARRGQIESHATAYDSFGRVIHISFVPIDQQVVDVNFSRGGSYDITGRGQAGYVLATVVNAIKQYVKAHKPDLIIIGAKEPSRQRVYDSLIARHAREFGYYLGDKDDLPDSLEDFLGWNSVPEFILKRGGRRINEAGLIYRGYRCTKDCSGHKAGFSWARYWGLIDPNKCPYGKSNSFWEGCKSIIPGTEK